jgi:hypothetical protein
MSKQNQNNDLCSLMSGLKIKSNKKDENIEEKNNILINLEYINNRINKEVCDETINKLKDINLLNEYKECKSVKNEIKKLDSILQKYNIESEKKQSILNDYLLELIPAGTKGVIKGNKFNSIVKNAITNLKLDSERFEICFEKQCELNITNEIPDWYILEKSTGKVIIGMNQLDFWKGGHQVNRGSKYLFDTTSNTEKNKLLCVICNRIKFDNNKTKIYKFFEIGYKNNTLCHIKNIETIIKKYFN